jgi:hypothetical protein
MRMSQSESSLSCVEIEGFASARDVRWDSMDERGVLQYIV